MFAKDGITEKLDKLRAEYPSDGVLVDQMETTLREKIALTKYADLDVTKMILKDAVKRVEAINFMLANDEKMTSEDRKALFMQKKIWDFVIARFGMKAVFRSIDQVMLKIDQSMPASEESEEE